MPELEPATRDRFRASVRAMWNELARLETAQRFGNLEGGSVEQQRDRRLQLHHCANYAALLTLLADEKRPRVLVELGCGSGALSCAFARAMPSDWTLVATDYSSGLVARAAAAYAGRNLRFEQMDVRRLDRVLLGRADAVFFLEVIEHLPQPAAAAVLREIRACLRPGARLVLSTLDRSPFPRPFSGYAPHYVEYTYRSLVDFLRSPAGQFGSVDVHRLVSDRIAREAVASEQNGGYLVNRVNRLVQGMVRPFPAAAGALGLLARAAFRCYSLFPQKDGFDLEGYLDGIDLVTTGAEEHDHDSFGLVAVLTAGEGRQ